MAVYRIDKTMLMLRTSSSSLSHLRPLPILNPSSSFSTPRFTPQFHSPNPSRHVHTYCFKRPFPLHPRGMTTALSASYSTGVGGGESRTGSGAGKEILVQHLLVKEDDLNLLVELQRRVLEGEDLSDLAVQYSLCPSKEEGGMLGWVRRGQMVPEFEEAAFGATPNRVVKCKTKFGWHLLQVLSEREASVLEDIQPVELHGKMQDPSFLEEAQLIDVREPDEVDKASLPGFKVLPLRQFGDWGPQIAQLINPQKDTYVMCHHGMRSLQVAKWLQTQGFRKVFNVSGGIHEYAAKVDSSVPIY